jgi:hypothetical protein
MGRRRKEQQLLSIRRGPARENKRAGPEHKSDRLVLHYFSEAVASGCRRGRQTLSMVGSFSLISIL